MIAQGGVEHVLGGRVFLDGLDVHRDGDVEVRQLDGDWGQGFDHLCLVGGQASGILEVA